MKGLSVLSLVSLLWPLNSGIGARVAVREGLPAERVAGLYGGQVSSENLLMFVADGAQAPVPATCAPIAK